MNEQYSVYTVYSCYVIIHYSWNEALSFIGGTKAHVCPDLAESVKNQNVNYKNLYKAFSALCDKSEEPFDLCKSMMKLDFSDSLHRVSCPAMIICGEKDRVNGKMSKQLATLLQDARLEYISGAGHEVNVEAPDKLGMLLKQFYEKIQLFL